MANELIVKFVMTITFHLTHLLDHQYLIQIIVIQNYDDDILIVSDSPSIVLRLINNLIDIFL